MDGEYSHLNVVELKPTLEGSTRDKILGALQQLVADIEAGDIDPSHLVYFVGQTIEVEDNEGVAYMWDSIGLSFYETIGHLMSYVTILSSEGPS